MRWRPVDGQTGQITDLAALEQLARDLPDSGSVRLRLLNAYLAQDMDQDAIAMAAELALRGHSFSPAAMDYFASLSPPAAEAQALELSLSNAGSISASRVLASVPAAIHLVESVWRDPRSGDLFVSSVVSRGLFVMRGEGEWQQVALPGAGSITGMTFDAESGWLWIASGVVDVTPDPGTGFRGLIAVDPTTGQEMRRVSAGPQLNLSDITAGPAGEIDASDPLSGAVYIARPGSMQLETLIAPGTFRSPQGLALLPAAHRLLVSDYRYGLASIDLVTGTVLRVPALQDFLLDGIDGLWIAGGRLFAIQNGTSPMRIVELVLSDDGSAVAGVTNLEIAHPDWTEPLGGSVSQGVLLYVANGQWDRFGEGGSVNEGQEPVPTEIRSLLLGP